jgi:hypothetical protein
VQAMSTMLQEAMHDCLNVHRFPAAVKIYHVIMLTHFPKVTTRIYEHALLVHVPSVLSSGSLLDSSSWFLEAYNKVWKHQLFYQWWQRRSQKNRKGKLLISRAKLGATSSWQRGQQEKI